MKAPPAQRPVTVTITILLLFAIAAIWLVFGLIVTLGLHPYFNTTGIFRWIMAACSIAAAMVLVGLVLLLRKRIKPAWYLGVILLSLMTLANLFDDIGWIDLLVMIGSLIPLILLIKDRKWYLQTPNQTKH